MFTKLYSYLRPILVAFLTMAAGLLAGCVTTPPAPDCSPREKDALAREIPPTRARLDRDKAALSRLRAERTLWRCTASPFALSAGSPHCENLVGASERLRLNIETLEGRLAELNAAVTGHRATGRYIRSCRATWKPAPPRHAAKKKALTRKIAKAARKRPSPMMAVLRPPAPVAPGALAYRPVVDAPITATSVVMLRQEPRAQTVEPPAERPYAADPRVRLVGSAFFPDLSGPAIPPVPARAPAP